MVSRTPLKLLMGSAEPIEPMLTAPLYIILTKEDLGPYQGYYCSKKGLAVNGICWTVIGGQGRNFDLQVPSLSAYRNL